MGNSSIEIYHSPEGNVELNVKLENETVWLNRQQMSELFNRDVKTIGKHINNALNEELAGEPVVAKFATARKYGRVEGLYQERYLYGPGGEKRIANNTLVALTLMIAESRTEEMDIIVKVVVNLINRENTGI